MTTSYRPTGLVRYHATGAYRGYTLFSANGGDDAFLIDMEGNFVHRWHYPGGIAYGFLLDNDGAPLNWPGTRTCFFVIRVPTRLAPTISGNWTRTAGWSGNITTPACGGQTAFVHRWHYPGTPTASCWTTRRSDLLFRDQPVPNPTCLLQRDRISAELTRRVRTAGWSGNITTPACGATTAFPTATTCSCCNATGYPRN